jgi:hypothetical protein
MTDTKGFPSERASGCDEKVPRVKIWLLNLAITLAPLQLWQLPFYQQS